MNQKAEAPRLVLVGAGAIAESFYLPGLARLPAAKRLVLVDNNPNRAETMAEKFGIEAWSADLAGVKGTVDGAIIATPHQLHFSQAKAFLHRGVPVLCEKPLAETARQAEELAAQSRANKAVLCVNNTRRLFPSFRKVKQLLQEGAVGEVVSFDAQEGGEYAWPTVSGFYFRGTGAGQGVLLDRGAHLLDLLCWWFEGRPVVDQCRDDSFGGCEAVADIRLTFPGPVSGSVRFSWLSRLKNEIQLRGSHGTIVCRPHDWRYLALQRNGKQEILPLVSDIRYFSDFGRVVIENFIAAVQGLEPLLVSGESVIDSIALIEECYQKRQRFEMPWM